MIRHDTFKSKILIASLFPTFVQFRYLDLIANQIALFTYNLKRTTDLQNKIVKSSVIINCAALNSETYYALTFFFSNQTFISI